MVQKIRNNRESILSLLFLFLLSIVPFAPHVGSNTIVGAGPDVISTLWGMWWFQQEGISSVLGVESMILNFPYGATGVVLSPSSAFVWALCEPLLGGARALVCASWMQIALISMGCGLLAHRAQGNWFWGSLVPLIGTYLFFGVGEGSLVAIACAPFIFGLYCLLQIDSNRWVWAFGAGLCMIWMALENPYLAPCLPALVGIFWIRYKQWRGQYTLSLLIGCVGVLYIAAMFGAAANPDYPREVAGTSVRLWGAVWRIVELPWAQMDWYEFFIPTEVRWTTSAEDATQASGGRYLGLSVVLLAGYGLWTHKKNWSWMLLSVVGIVLAMGSMVYGMAFPFLFLNHIMDVVARPLTQPTRYLCLAMVGLSVCVSCAVTTLSFRVRSGLLAILLLDSFCFGAMSLSIPHTSFPNIECSFQGPTLLYPWDARDGELGMAQLHQMVHDQPAAHTGIASWALPEGKRAMDKLRGAAFYEGSPMIRFSQLYRLGYRHIYSTERLRGRTAKEEQCGVQWHYILYP